MFVDDETLSVENISDLTQLVYGTLFDYVQENDPAEGITITEPAESAAEFTVRDNASGECYIVRISRAENKRGK